MLGGELDYEVWQAGQQNAQPFMRRWGHLVNAS